MRTKHLRRSVRRLRLERLEDRTLPASAITIVAGAAGSGTLDSFVSPADGTVTTSDGGSSPGTLSTGALVAVGAGANINIAAQTGITFNDLGGTLTLQTGLGGSATFTAGSGAITFTAATNTLATGGAGLTFSAGTNLTLANLNAAGGDLALTAGTAGAGNISANRIVTSGAGNITLQATNVAGGTITQAGGAFGKEVFITARGNVVVDDLRGAGVTLASSAGSVTSLAGNSIQGSTLKVTAATGITINTLVASLTASNSRSGEIAVTQAAAPAQPLAVGSAGVVNSAFVGTITLTNLGDAITVNSGAGVMTFTGPVTLAAQDLSIGGPIKSQGGRVTLTNSVAGGQIDLGSNTAGKLGLTQADIANVTAGVLQVGSAEAGHIVISAAITAPATWNTLALVGGSEIMENHASTGALTVPNLRVSAANFADLRNLNNNVGTVAAATWSDFDIDSVASPLVVDVVDGVTGVTTNHGGIYLLVHDIDLRQAVVSGGVGVSIGESPGVVSLGADTSGAVNLSDAELGRVTAASLFIYGDSVAIAGPVTRHTGFNTLVLDALVGGISQTAPLSVAKLAVQSEGDFSLNNVSNDVDTLAGTTLFGVQNQFEFRDANALAIGTVDGFDGIHAKFVLLTAGGPITGGAAGAPDVSASLAGVDAASGITLTVGSYDPNVTGLFGVRTTGNGPITLTAAGTISPSNIDAGTGAITLAGGTFRLQFSDDFADASTLAVTGGATLDMATFSDTVAMVRLQGGTITGGGTLTATNGFDLQSGTISAPLGGFRPLVKTTPGMVTLSGSNSYTSPTTISDGTLIFNGTAPSAGPVTVGFGALGGVGTIKSKVTVQSGATLAPGSGPGTLHTGDLAFSFAATYAVDLNSPYSAAGFDYDQVSVTGTVFLDEPTLTLVGGGVAPQLFKVLTIIRNDGTDPVSGTFAGLPEGAVVRVGSFVANISYKGGDGNDVTLTANPIAPSFTSANNTTFTTGVAGSFTVTAVGVPGPALSESAADVLPAGVTFNASTGVLSGTPGPGAAGTYALHFTAHNIVSPDATQTFTFTVNPSTVAAVSSVVVNAGQPNVVQRSTVTSVTVTFSKLVSFAGSPATAFQLARTGPGTQTGNVTLAVDLSGSTPTQTVARLTFSGSLTEGANSLVDGSYSLTVLSAQLQGGIQGGDNLTSLFRLFGDVNGDKAVDGLDLTAFRNAFGSVQGNASHVSFLDFNGDGAIDGADLTQFRNRFGVILP
jgi:autotransporter-associated beta strand protein